MEVGGRPRVRREMGARGSSGPSGGHPQQPGPHTELGTTQARPRGPFHASTRCFTPNGKSRSEH